MCASMRMCKLGLKLSDENYLQTKVQLYISSLFLF